MTLEASGYYVLSLYVSKKTTLLASQNVMEYWPISIYAHPCHRQIMHVELYSTCRNPHCRKKYSRMSLSQTFRSLGDKVKTGLRPRARRERNRPQGLLVKTASLERGGDGRVVEVESVLGEEGVGEFRRLDDSEYSIYREELLDT